MASLAFIMVLGATFSAADLCEEVMSSSKIVNNQYSPVNQLLGPLSVHNVSECLKTVPVSQLYLDNIVNAIKTQFIQYYVYHDIIRNSTDVPPAARRPCGLAIHESHVDVDGDLERIRALSNLGDVLEAIERFTASLHDAHTFIAVNYLPIYMHRLRFGSRLESAPSAADRADVSAASTPSQVFYLKSVCGSRSLPNHGAMQPISTAGMVSQCAPVPQPWSSYEGVPILSINGEAPLAYILRLADEIFPSSCHKAHDAGARLNCVLTSQLVSGSIPPKHEGLLTIRFRGHETAVTGPGWEAFLIGPGAYLGGSSHDPATAAIFQRAQEHSNGLASMLHTYFAQSPWNSQKVTQKAAAVPGAAAGIGEVASLKSPRREAASLLDSAAHSQGYSDSHTGAGEGGAGTDGASADGSTIPSTCRAGLRKAQVPTIWDNVPEVPCSDDDPQATLACTLSVHACTYRMADGTHVEQYYLAKSTDLSSLGSLELTASATKYSWPSGVTMKAGETMSWRGDSFENGQRTRPLVAFKVNTFEFASDDDKKRMLALARKAVDMAADSAGEGEEPELLVDISSNGGGLVSLSYILQVQCPRQQSSRAQA